MIHIAGECRAPPAPVAAFLSPVLWRLNQPDRFDMYSIGIVMLQLAFQSLRNDNGLTAFNVKLQSYQYDLNAWRASLDSRALIREQEGFKILDANNKAGWELVCKVRSRLPSPGVGKAPAPIAFRVTEFTARAVTRGHNNWRQNHIQTSNAPLMLHQCTSPRHVRAMPRHPPDRAPNKCARPSVPAHTIPCDPKSHPNFLEHCDLISNHLESYSNGSHNK